MTNNYRVLVVEDDSEAREAISEELMELKPRGRMECDLSTGVRDATKKVKAKYYDLVLVDLELGANQRGALDLYTHLTENHAACELILMTSINLDSGMGELVRLFGDRSRPRFVGFIDKREDLTRQIQEEIGSRYAEFTQNSVDFVNLELPVTLLERRKHRYNRPNTFPLRSDNAEVGVEIDRLLRKLYVQLPVGRRLSGVRVSLDRVGRRAERHGVRQLRRRRRDTGTQDRTEDWPTPRHHRGVLPVRRVRPVRHGAAPPGGAARHRDRRHSRRPGLQLRGLPASPGPDQHGRGAEPRVPVRGYQVVRTGHPGCVRAQAVVEHRGGGQARGGVLQGKLPDRPHPFSVDWRGIPARTAPDAEQESQGGTTGPWCGWRRPGALHPRRPAADRPRRAHAGRWPASAQVVVLPGSR